MNQLKIEELNRQIISEIIACIRTNAKVQEIDIEQAPYHIKPRGIRHKNLLKQLRDDRELTHNESFSSNTLDKYLTVLKREKWVNRYAPSHRKVIYELNEQKIEEAKEALKSIEVSGRTIEEIGKLAYTLNSHYSEILFGIFGTLTDEKIKRLIYIRDTCRKIATEIELLNLPEVKA